MRILSQARPIRIAYLVEEENSWPLILDAIFLSSRGVWGGRFHIIVPVVNGRPLDSFVAWLRAYDPDLIYSYCDLNNDMIESLNETVAPSYLVRHERLRSDKATSRDFRPQHKYNPLSIETVLPYATLPYRHRRGDRVSVLDAYYGDAGHDPFVQQNFGQFTGSTGRGYPRSLSEFADVVHFLSDNELQPRRRYGIQNLSTITSLVDILSRLSNGTLLTSSLLSSISVPRLDFHAAGWDSAFNVVVGDSFVDRITFWNARSLFPRWRDGQFVDLILPARLLDDSKTLSAIGKFIREVNQVSRGDSGGSGGNAIVRSSSVNVDDLEGLARLLQGDSGWVTYQTSAIEGIEAHIPSGSALSKRSFVYTDGIGPAVEQNWEESEVIGPQINIRAPRPDHLKYTSPALLTSHSGAWAVELDIPRHNDLSKYQNRSQS